MTLEMCFAFCIQKHGLEGNLKTAFKLGLKIKFCIISKHKNPKTD